MQTGIGSAYLIKGFSTSHFHENPHPSLEYRGALNSAASNSANLEQHGFQFVPELLEQRGFGAFCLEQRGFG